MSSGTWANNGDLTVGVYGTGTLNLTGGSVTNSNGYIGLGVESVGRATVSSGTWANSGDLYVGNTGSGTLNLTGGSVTSANSYLGSAVGGVGIASISGGDWTTSGDFVVGNEGTGTLQISNSGIVTVEGAISRGEGSVINLDAGGTLQIGSGGETGTLNVSALDYSGTLLFNRSNNVQYSGNLTGSGNLQKYGNGTLTLAGSSSLGSSAEPASAIHAGTLKLQNGGSLTINQQSFHVGSAAGESATLEIGNRGVFQATGNGTSLILGETSGASGTLKVTAGGTFAGANVLVGNGGGTGAVVQTGGILSGTLLDIGTQGTGTVSVSGGTMTMNTIQLGSATGSDGTLTITGGRVDVVESLTYGNGDGTHAINLNAGGTLQIGTGGTSGSLNIAALAYSGTLAFNRSNDSQYSGTLTGAGNLQTYGEGTLTLTGSSSLGASGYGESALHGGTLQMQGGGSLTINDQSFHVGNTAGDSATLEIGNGGSFESLGGTILGETSGASGTLRVIDGGSFTGGALSVGQDGGSGTLVLTSGSITTTNGSIGQGAGGSGSATVSGGTWANSGDLSVGLGGSGTLDVTGGTVSNAGDLYVGNGSLTVTSGSLTTANGYIQGNADGDGNVTVSGGLLAASGDIVVGSGDAAGTLTINSGTVVVAGVLDRNNGTVNLNSGGTLQIGTGGNSGALGNSLSFSGTLAVNRSGDLQYGSNLTGVGNLQKYGDGTLTLMGSNSLGAANSADSAVHAGTLLVKGPGGSSRGSLTINGQSFHVGTAAGESATLEIGGAGVFQATANGSSLILGETSGASGTLKVVGGGTFAGANVLVGKSGGTGTVVQTGGILSGNLLDIGSQGTGTVSVSGGTMTMNTIQLGSATASSGTLTITGGRVNVVDSLTSGNGYGTHAINLNAGGTLSIGTGGNTGTLDVAALANNGTLIFNRSTASTYSGIMSGTGAVTKQGTGTLELSGSNSYSGTTTVSAGGLKVNGSTGTGAMTIASGAALSGTGTIGGNTTISGTHNPGNSPGVQTFSSDLTYVSAGLTGPKVFWELAANITSNSPTEYDQIVVGGNLAFHSATSFDLAFGSSGSTVDWSDTFWATNEQWTIYSVSGSLSSFSNLQLTTSDWLDGQGNWFNSLLAGNTFSLVQIGQNIVLQYTVAQAAVPEIDLASFGSALALLLGACGLQECRRRRFQMRRVSAGALLPSYQIGKFDVTIGPSSPAN